MVAWHNNPRQRRYLFKIMPFGILWCVFSLVYVLVEHGLLGDSTVYPSTGNPYDFRSTLWVTPISALVSGLLMGTAEVMFLNRLFVHRPFWKKILFKTVVYLAVIVAMLVGISLATSGPRLDVAFLDPAVFDGVRSFIGNFAFWSIVIYAGLLILVSLYVSETADYLGGSVVGNFFTGRYHRPVQEQRIFMFLDMKSSTTIAEQLGHQAYFRLLDQYYADTTNPILDTWGEVYQYAGDEIVVSWDMRRGLQDNNCIRCFFLIRQAIDRQASAYSRSYGVVPTFKAGLHCGSVTTGEIGVLKKELFFTGDVVNTAARVQAKCNELGVDLLVSDELASQLDADGAYTLVPKGEVELRGKRHKTSLHAVTQAAPTSGAGRQT